MNRFVRSLALLLALYVCSVAAAHAQTSYPDRPVKIIVAFAAGGPTDVVARIVGEGGCVLGVDRDPAPIAVARRRAAELGLGRVAFEERDLAALSPTAERFDAAVARSLCDRRWNLHRNRG
mgnify:CR=1 FL=1